ncbi:MAG: Cupin domain protein [Verrucomicrobia bacterium]|jgi:quercetin dioxygenase-like cupin family protein|nr:MAG: Cupin domain protein [Verrucomicrobiota bacterium]
MKKNTLLSPATAGTCSLLAPVENVAHGIISRAVLTTPALRLTLFHFAAGQELSEHTSKARALVQVLSGTCQFTVGADRHTLRTGDLLHLPPGAPHSLTTAEPFSMLLTQVTELAAGE